MRKFLPRFLRMGGNTSFNQLPVFFLGGGTDGFKHISARKLEQPDRKTRVRQVFSKNLFSPFRRPKDENITRGGSFLTPSETRPISSFFGQINFIFCFLAKKSARTLGMLAGLGRAPFKCEEVLCLFRRYLHGTYSDSLSPAKTLAIP